MKKEIKQFIELTRDNLENNAGCGGWCIRCALANALNKFDEDNGGISVGESIQQVITGNVRPISKIDFIMGETRTYLKSFGDERMVFKTKKEAGEFLDNAIIPQINQKVAK